MAVDAGASDGIAERTAAELEGFVMKRTSGEQERAEPLGALSRPDRLKPVPAGLSLSSRRRPHAPVLDAQRRRRLTREVVRVRVSQPSVSVQAIVSRVSRSSTWAPPPKALTRGREQAFAHWKPQRPVRPKASAHRWTNRITC